jgi:hypothetical protein
VSKDEEDAKNSSLSISEKKQGILFFYETISNKGQEM